MKKAKKVKIAVVIVAALVLLLGGTGIFYFKHVIGKANYLTDEQIRAMAKDENNESVDPSKTETPEQAIQDINQNLTAFNGLNQLLDRKNVYNIMLLGSDTREANTIGRTDTMILVSINKDTKKIYLTSFMRDCYVKIPGYGNNRLNTAFTKGSKVLFNALAENFGIKVDRYIYVNFFDFIDVVDKIGGIDVEINKTEMKQINKLFKEINKYLKVDKNDGKLTGYGKIHLTGKQTLAYARVRHLKGSDFNRTERQREVVDQLIKQLKSKNPLELNDLANKILPLVSTNLEQSELETLIMNALTYMTCDVVNQRIPNGNSWSEIYVRGACMLNVDLKKNRDFLASTIYNEKPKTSPSPAASEKKNNKSKN